MDAVLVVAIFTLVAVVAVPVTFPVSGPENAEAVTVPVDGLTLTVDTVEVAAPETPVVAGVNTIGWLALVVAVTISIFLDV